MVLLALGGAVLALLALADLDGAEHVDLVVAPAPFAARASADERLVDLDRMLRTDWIAVEPHGPRAELLHHHVRRLVARQRELPLELHRTLAVRLRGHQVGGPKPRRQRHVRLLHDGPRRQGRHRLAVPALEGDRRAMRRPVRLVDHAALAAREALGPAELFEVRGARSVVREDNLELRQRRGEAAGIHSAAPCFHDALLDGAPGGRGPAVGDDVQLQVRQRFGLREVVERAEEVCDGGAVDALAGGQLSDAGSGELHPPKCTAAAAFSN